MANSNGTTAPQVTIGSDDGNFLYIILEATEGTLTSEQNQKGIDAQTVKLASDFAELMMNAQNYWAKYWLGQLDKQQKKLDYWINNGDKNWIAYHEKQISIDQAKYQHDNTKWGNAVSQAQSGLSQMQGWVQTDTTNTQQQLQILNSVVNILQVLTNLLTASY